MTHEQQIKAVAEAIYKTGMAYYHSQMPLSDCHHGFQETFFKAAQAAIAAMQVREMPEGWCTLGVGDGSGKLFVHGDYESIKACQAKLLKRESGTQAAHADMLPVLERVRESMRAMIDHYSTDESGKLIAGPIAAYDLEQALTELEAIMKQQGEKL